MEKVEVGVKFSVAKAFFEAKTVGRGKWLLRGLEWVKVIASRPDLPLVSARSDVIRCSRILLSPTLDAARSY